MSTKLKQTEIGQIPEDWQLIELGSISKIKGGKRLPKGENFAKSKTEFPYIRVVDFQNMNIDLNNLKYLTSQIHEKIKNYTISSDDVYISIAGTIGLVGLIPKQLDGANLTENAAKICDLKVADKTYIAYALTSDISSAQIKSFIGKATQPKLALFRLEKIKLLLPPLLEQRAIANVLSTVDSAIELTERERQRIEWLKVGIMKELFEGKKWKSVRLGEIVNVFDSKRVTLSEMERSKKKGNYPYCGANGIIDYINDFLFDGEYLLLAEDGGDYNKFGKSTYLMSGKFWVNNHAHILKAIEGRTTNIFLFYVLNFTDLRRYIVGSTRTKLNQEAMLKIDIPLPLLEEQKRIAEILSTIDQKLALVGTKKSKLERIKKGLMNDLLTGKKRVKVEV